MTCTVTGWYVIPYWEYWLHQHFCFVIWWSQFANIQGTYISLFYMIIFSRIGPQAKRWFVRRIESASCMHLALCESEVCFVRMLPKLQKSGARCVNQMKNSSSICTKSIVCWRGKCWSILISFHIQHYCLVTMCFLLLLKEEFTEKCRRCSTCLMHISGKTLNSQLNGWLILYVFLVPSFVCLLAAETAQYNIDFLNFYNNGGVTKLLWPIVRMAKIRRIRLLLENIISLNLSGKKIKLYTTKRFEKCRKSLLKRNEWMGVWMWRCSNGWSGL